MLRLLKVLFWSIVDFVLLPIHYLPGHIGSRLLRPWVWKFRLKKLGRGCIIDPGVHFINPECISIGDHTWIDKGVILGAGKSSSTNRKMYYLQNQNFNGEEGCLYIGRNCHIAPYVVIVAQGGVRIGNNLTIAAGSKVYSISHHYRNLSDRTDHFVYKFSSMAPVDEQAIILGPIVIDDNAAIGLNSVILPGVTVGQNSWIGVHSVVNRDIPSCVIAKGNPCEIIKRRKIDEHQLEI